MSDLLAIPHWLRGLECKLEEIAKLLVEVSTPLWALALEEKLNQILDLEGVIISDQEHLNSDIASLATDFAAIIDALKNTPVDVPLDFTAADALVASVHGAVPAPVVEPPVDTPPADVPVTDTSVATA